MSIEGIGTATFLNFGDFELPDIGQVPQSFKEGQEYSFTVKYKDEPPIPEPEKLSFILNDIEIGTATVNEDGKLEVQAYAGCEGLIEEYLREIGLERLI